MLENISEDQYTLSSDTELTLKHLLLPKGMFKNKLFYSFFLWNDFPKRKKKFNSKIKILQQNVKTTNLNLERLFCWNRRRPLSIKGFLSQNLLNLKQNLIILKKIGNSLATNKSVNILSVNTSRRAKFFSSKFLNRKVLYFKPYTKLRKGILLKSPKKQKEHPLDKLHNLFKTKKSNMFNKWGTKRLVFLRNLFLSSTEFSTSSSEEKRLDTLFRIPIYKNILASKPNKLKNSSIYRRFKSLNTTWSSRRLKTSSTFFNKLFSNRITLLKRKSHPHAIKPWLFDLVLNSYLNEKNDKEGKIRKELHDQAQSQLVLVSGKNFATIDEESRRLDLEILHKKLSESHIFSNLYLDHLKDWTLPNFIKLQEEDPAIGFFDKKSYKLHQSNDAKNALLLLKRFFGKKKFKQIIKPIVKANSLAFKSRNIYINYPLFKKKSFKKPTFIIPNFNLKSLNRDGRIKTKFFKLNYYGSSSTISSKSLLPTQYLLKSSHKITLLSNIYRDFSFLNFNNLFEKYFLFYWTFFIDNSFSHFSKLEAFLIPKSFLILNNKLSFTTNFFSSNRLISGNLKKSKPFFKNWQQPKTLNSPNYIHSKYRVTSLPQFLQKYLTYLTFRVNLRQNPIRRPLYSLFLSSLNILKKHSFRLFFSKKNLSLQRFPTPLLNRTGRNYYHNLSYLGFKSIISSRFIDLSSDSVFLKKGITHSNFNLLSNLGSFLDSLNSSFFEKSNFSSNIFYKNSPDTLVNVSKKCLFLKNNLLLLFSWDNVQILENLFSFPILYKFFFWNYKNMFQLSQSSINFTWSRFIKKFSNNLNFTNSLNCIEYTNIVPLGLFKNSFKKRIIKTFSTDIYMPSTTIYFYKTLISFIEFHTGKRVYLKLNPFLEGSLSFKDSCRCSIWYNKINVFQKILGHRIFVHESLRIFTAAIRFRDPTFLSNWIRAMLYRMSFWKYRTLFRYIKYVFRGLFSPYFTEFNFKGVSLVVRGKISVAGNARTRTLAFSVGNTSHSEMNNRVLSNFSTIDSFTGVMGFRLSFYF